MSSVEHWVSKASDTFNAVLQAKQLRGLTSASKAGWDWLHAASHSVTQPVTAPDLWLPSHEKWSSDPPEPRCGVQVSEVDGPEQVCMNSQPPETLIFSDYRLSAAFQGNTEYWQQSLCFTVVSLERLIICYKGGQCLLLNEFGNSTSITFIEIVHSLSEYPWSVTSYHKETCLHRLHPVFPDLFIKPQGTLFVPQNT